MPAVSLKQQKQGELIASETIEGVAQAIAENFHPEKIILFGSYASGTKHEVTMGEQDRLLIEEFKRRLPTDIVSHIRQMILYGSRARGDAEQDSDLDLVALVDEHSPDLEYKLDEIAYNPVSYTHLTLPTILRV